MSRTVGVVACIGGLALAFVTPAWADEGLNGTYNLTWNDGDASTWVISSTCSSADSCVARVASGQGRIGGSTVSGDARLVNGQWTLTLDKPDGIQCSDGTRAPTHNEYSWAASTLSGTLVESWGAVCEEPAPGRQTFTFTMTKA